MPVKFVPSFLPPLVGFWVEQVPHVLRDGSPNIVWFSLCHTHTHTKKKLFLSGWFRWKSLVAYSDRRSSLIYHARHTSHRVRRIPTDPSKNIPETCFYISRCVYARLCILLAVLCTPNTSLPLLSFSWFLRLVVDVCNGGEWSRGCFI